MRIKTLIIKNSYLFILSALTIISFIMLITAGSVLFGRHKADITSLHRTTINPQSEKIVKNLDSPVNITVYQSENLGSEYPELGLQSQFLFRLLERYQTLANGKITINVKNPEPFSLAEEEALNAGIRAFPNNSGNENLYFGAIFNNEKGTSFTIPYFSIQRQNYTEHDISRVLGKLGKFKKKTIGIAAFDADADEWQFLKQLKNDYNVQKINLQEIAIPSNISVLLVYNPQQIPNSFIYALDQYIMRGGKLILLLDPYSEQTIAKHPSSALYKNKILPLLNKWGIRFNPNEVVGDKKFSPKEHRNALQNNDSVLWFNIPHDKENDNIFTKGFLNFNFRTPGALTTDKMSNADYQPLFTTSSEGGLVSADFAKFASKETVNGNFS
ncbi:MAG: GldG family protein, partial [Muribaculaceae bacterium]|nr:GldG family protein [Muribaculaceae bacterium]